MLLQIKTKKYWQTTQNLYFRTFEIKYLIKTINSGEAGEYEKYFIKIRFESDDNLPLNKTLKIHMLTVFVRSVVEEDAKYYPQIFAYECLYELEKGCNTVEVMFLKELTLITEVPQKGL